MLERIPWDAVGREIAKLFRVMVVVALSLAALFVVAQPGQEAEADRERQLQAVAETTAKYNAAMACLLAETENRTHAYAARCFLINGVPVPEFPEEL